MITLRMMVLALLVVMITSLPIEIITPPAEASGFDEAREFAEYLCENYLWCE